MKASKVLLLSLLPLLPLACTSPASEPASEEAAAETAPAPDETATATAAQAEVPSMREDDSDRKSKNGRLSAEVGGVPVVVQYGRPSVRGRTVFGDLVPYGEVWRTGADEATTLTLGTDAVIGGKTVPAGTYSLFTIPKEDGPWTVVINEVARQWGAYKYDASKDVARIEAEASEHEPTEVLTFAAEDDAIVLTWAGAQLSIPVARP